MTDSSDPNLHSSPQIEGLRNTALHHDEVDSALVQRALVRGEGTLGIGGGLLVSSGKHTGRSPKDKYFVASPENENEIWWENNGKMEPDAFNRLHKDFLKYLGGREAHVQNLQACADPSFDLNLRMVSEWAWHALFNRHLLRIPKGPRVSKDPDFTVFNCPGFEADPKKHGCRSNTVIAINLMERIVLIGGTGYAGENKKSVFTLLNHILPTKNVLPMHCAANHAHGDKNDSALFFGLSGTGKTTLSADPGRVLIGDDEHGWSDHGIFNFEGGCYAKAVNLSAEEEPDIYRTTSMFGTVVENVSYDRKTLDLDFADTRVTPNSRCAYPIEYIPYASRSGTAGPPKNVFMLTCDASGVLPPIAKLSPDYAVRCFITGYTSKIGGTERGIKEPQPVFSECFGKPFLPRRPEIYGRMMREKLVSTGADCWLVNTGWSGGPYGTGKRMPIKITRALLGAALNGDFSVARFRIDPNFGFQVPLDAPGIPASILDPRSTWANPDDYDLAASKLAFRFEEQFATYAEFFKLILCRRRLASIPNHDFSKSEIRRSFDFRPNARIKHGNYIAGSIKLLAFASRVSKPR